jgi:diguanylate cyclase (GGDEF)-like protein
MLTLIHCFENTHLREYLEQKKNLLPPHRSVYTHCQKEFADFLDTKITKPALALITAIEDRAEFYRAIDKAGEQDIPVIVLTDNFDENIRTEILEKSICDYFIKNEFHMYHNLEHFISRLSQNIHTKVLVVDDSNMTLLHIKFMLENHLYTVLEARTGQEALDVLSQNPDITLAVVDYYMPKMKGYELTTQIRKIKTKEELAIIGMSANSANPLTARFLKEGANDFLAKPFIHEEFYCRINQNVEYIERINSLKNLSHRDHLTNIFNRRYFFEIGEKIYASAQSGIKDISVALVDIDNFKKINDNYGHHAGDVVLKHLADTFLLCIRPTDIFARFGGEEFLILFVDPECGQHATECMEKMRQQIEASTVKIDDQEVKYTFSCGITWRLNSSLEAMIQEADNLLYKAKHDGKNRIETI